MKKNNLSTCFEKYSDESLHAYCAEFGIQHEQLSNEEMREQLACKMRNEKTLERRLGILDDEELNGLHALYNKEVVNTEEVLDHLDGLDFIYGSKEDNQWHVVEEVEQVFQIENEEWNQDRINRVWLMKCLVIVSHMWADVPVETMKELYNKNPRVTKDADLEMLFKEIPVSEITCVLIDHSFVIRGWRTSEVFAVSRETQKDKSFYIPSVEEVLDLYENDYDTQEEYTKNVKKWYMENGADDEEMLNLLLHELWNDINYGHTEKNVQETSEVVISFDNEQEREEFRTLIHEWFIHTRKLEYRGHSFIELQS